MLHGEGKEGAVTFEAIHGQDTSVIKAADLDLARFMALPGPHNAPAPASELPAEPRAVLLTGANGFLGRFLLLDLLQRVSQQCAPPDHSCIYLTIYPESAARVHISPASTPRCWKFAKHSSFTEGSWGLSQVPTPFPV